MNRPTEYAPPQDLVHHGQEFIVAHGGRGGRGNIRFATPKNPAPEISENGEPGQERELQLPKTHI